jgi:protein import protein ZIM17
MEEPEVKVSTATLGEREVELHQTKGSISIFDRVQGVKAESGEMYILKFTCNKCETQSIRSFTKHAYHKGVVMVRCGGCEAIHLIADNIGWFEDKPVNVETMHPGKVQRVSDQAAIVSFLQKAFDEEKTPKKEEQVADKGAASAK